MKKTIEYIYSDILEISDLELQKKLWLNENNETTLISSYTELMCRLFDENNFDDFVDNGAAENGFSTNKVLLLKELRNLLNSYDEKETDAEIINDPEWKKIVAQAKSIIEVWER